MVLSGRAAHELSNRRGRLPETVRGRTRGQNQHVLGNRPQVFRFAPNVAVVLLVLAYKWATSRREHRTRASWTVQHAAATNDWRAGPERHMEDERSYAARLPSRRITTAAEAAHSGRRAFRIQDCVLRSNGSTVRRSQNDRYFRSHETAPLQRRKLVVGLTYKRRHM